MTVLEMAQKYYPALWSADRLKELVAAGKLPAAEYQEITGEEYNAT